MMWHLLKIIIRNRFPAKSNWANKRIFAFCRLRSQNLQIFSVLKLSIIQYLVFYSWLWFEFAGGLFTYLLISSLYLLAVLMSANTSPMRLFEKHIHNFLANPSTAFVLKNIAKTFFYSAFICSKALNKSSIELSNFKLGPPSGRVCNSSIVSKKLVCFFLTTSESIYCIIVL